MWDGASHAWQRNFVWHKHQYGFVYTTEVFINLPIPEYAIIKRYEHKIR